MTKKRTKWLGLKQQQNFLQASKPFKLNEFSDEFLDLCEQIRPDVVVFDTTSHYIGKVDTKDATQTTIATEIFTEVARELKCSVVLIRHLTKGTRDKAMYRGQGSIAFIGVARIMIQAGYDPQDASTRLLFLGKANLTPKIKALEYFIDDDQRKNDPDRSRFHWGEFVEQDIEEAVNAKPGNGSEIDEAITFLEEVLDEGAVDLKRVEKMSEARSINRRTLFRAANKLDIHRETKGFGPEKITYWSLKEK